MYSLKGKVSARRGKGVVKRAIYRRLKPRRMNISYKKSVGNSRFQRRIKRKSQSGVRGRRSKLTRTTRPTYNQAYNQAYNEGFNQGFAKGFEDGHQMAYAGQV
ncbi:hypothetical protein [Paenibacillus marinisediminis]